MEASNNCRNNQEKMHGIYDLQPVFHPGLKAIEGLKADDARRVSIVSSPEQNVKTMPALAPAWNLPIESAYR